MREIKFQYILKSYNNTIVKRTVSLEDLQNGDLNFDGIPLKQMENNNLIIAKRRYTELNDKNGAEIYEDDIVKIKCGYIGEIVLNKGTFSVSVVYGRLDSMEEYDIEVIGNIYENPELLEMR